MSVSSHKSRFPNRRSRLRRAPAAVYRGREHRLKRFFWLTLLLLGALWGWDFIQSWLPVSLLEGAPPSAPAVAHRDTAPAPADEALKARALPEKITRPAAADTLDVRVSIDLGFSAVGFEIPAKSHALSLSDTPGPLLRRFPEFTGAKQQYASLEFNRGQSISLALDQSASGNRLYVDKNRNGDLRDDGAPLENQGSGRFSAKLRFDLPLVSGLDGLRGDYVLWLYLPKKDAGAPTLRYYAMTQLKGRMRLQGKLHDAWLADNRQTDGDYRNDGLYLDINQDGRITPSAEYIAPGEILSLAGRRYRFLIEP
jgi:hypothetical protein